MKLNLRGQVHGKIIELEEEPGLADGQGVRVTLEPISSGQLGRLPPGEGLRRPFGAWAGDAAELEKFLQWNRAQRKVGRRGIED